MLCKTPVLNPFAKRVAGKLGVTIGMDNPTSWRLAQCDCLVERGDRELSVNFPAHDPVTDAPRAQIRQCAEETEAFPSRDVSEIRPPCVVDF